MNKCIEVSMELLTTHSRISKISHSVSKFNTVNQQTLNRSGRYGKNKTVFGKVYTKAIDNLMYNFT